jgi:hypothetical protein
LFNGCGEEGLRDRLANLVLIIFNYDRCIEHYLFHSLVNYHEMSREQAAELMAGVRIYHPYGKVGNLPWENSAPSIETILRPSLPSDQDQEHSCYATAFDFSEPDIEVITRDFASLFQPGSKPLDPFEVKDLRCADLLRNYSRRLRWD